MGFPLHLAQQVGEQLTQLPLGHWNLDIEIVGTGIEPVQMVFQQVHHMIAANSGIINAIAKEMWTVIEWNHYLVRGTNLSIVVS